MIIKFGFPYKNGAFHNEPLREMFQVLIMVYQGHKNRYCLHLLTINLNP